MRIAVIVFSLSCFGCQSATQSDLPEPEIDALKAELGLLRDEVRSTDSKLEDVIATQLDIQDKAAGIAVVSRSVEAIPRALAAYCQEREPKRCEALKQVVIGDGDTMVVGELEHVWIEPPGMTLEARMDTGASRSSVSADEVVEFERDGDKWIRFVLHGADEPVTVERPVLKYVRVIQQADPDGTRRPVITLQVRLGELQDTFEFTLADRSHMSNQMILGRDFLTDIAIVDVSSTFVQPIYKPGR